MSERTKRHIWPVSLATALAVVGVMAAFIVLTSAPGAAQAQQGLCDTASGATLEALIDAGVCPADPGDGTDPGNGNGTDPGNGNGTDPGNGNGNGNGDGNGDQTASASSMSSSSNSSGAAVRLTLTIAAADMENLSAGDRIEIYLEDDYGVPDSISPSNVYFRVPGGNISVNGGGRVNAADVNVDDGDHFGGDDDYAIAILVPDMDPRDDFFGYPSAGADLNVVIDVGAGITNPTEEGDHSVGYSILTGTEGDNDDDGPEVSGANIATDSSDEIIGTSTMRTQAKVSLSDEDNTRGYELTVTGTGFNNGTTADVWVLSGGAEPASCADLIDNARSSKAGSALVETNDKAVVTFEVTVPTFRAGPDNHVCMVDGESRHSSDVDQFELEPSIRVVPSSASSGDIVNIFAQDFPMGGAGFDSIEISDQVIKTSGPSLNADGSVTVSLEIPGQLPDGTPLQGTVRVDASWGGTSEDAKITVTGSELSASQSDVLPNETITITGNGFGSQTCIPVSDITLDNVPVMVDDESAGACTDTRGDNISSNDLEFSNAVGVSNAGQFVATITMWPAISGTNPTLISGSHALSVIDSQGFVGATSVSIAEPTVTITPSVLGPRDYLVVTGANWPVDNLDNPVNVPVSIEIADYGQARTYPVYADNAGRFSVEHRVHRNVAIPSTNQVKASFGDVVKVGSYSVPAATVTVTPAQAQPGDLVTISATDMPVYTAADQVKIGGTEFNDPGVNTDRDGNITIDGLLVPGLDPGTYSVLLNVNGTIAIGSIDVQAEDSASGPGAMLPDALSELGDNLVRVFHFNGVDKSWDFYDPRPDFAELNTLTTMVNGEPYWILVSEGQDGVLLNNKSKDLTCVGGDCWNQIVW